MGISQAGAFFISLLRPTDGQYIIGGPARSKEVHGDHGELTAGAALQKETAVIVAQV
jgi:hypothetical protein